jgi:hypothetical protein
MKVIEFVGEMTAYGRSAEELQFRPPYLTLRQIHPTLAYYLNHAEPDHDIARRMEEVEKLWTAAGPSPLRQKLRVGHGGVTVVVMHRRHEHKFTR